MGDDGTGNCLFKEMSVEYNFFYFLLVKSYWFNKKKLYAKWIIGTLSCSKLKKKPKTYYSNDGYKLQYQSIVVFDSCLIREML